MPTIITTPSWNTTFSLNTTPKKFIFTDTTDYTTPAIPLTGVKGVFKITSPSGTVIYNNTTFGAGSDIVANVSLTNAITIPLPNLANQAPEQGIYTIVYTVQITDGVNPVYTINKTLTYNFTYVSPTVSITNDVDCIQPLITTTDTTNYIVGGITPTNTRTLTLTYPTNPLTSVINTTSATITTSTFYNGLQSVTVSSVLSYTISAGFFVADTVTGTKSINIDCSYVCQLYCCLKTLRNRKENARGVNDVLFDRYEAQFAEVMAELEMLFLAIDCGKQQDANNHIIKIKQIAECADDCSCTDGTPTKVTGLGIQNVNVVVASGGTPITVTSATVGGITTYTVSFDQTLVTKINNAYNTVVNATDSTVTVTDSGVISGVRTFGVKANYTVQNRMDFLCRIQYTLSTAATITNSAYLVSGTNMNPTATVASTTLPTAGTNNNFRVNAFQAVANNNYKVTIEPVIVTRHGSSYTRNSTRTFDVEIINKTSGSFDFRFVEVDGSTITNTGMVVTSDIYVNIKISE